MAKFRDVPVGDSKIQTALSKLKLEGTYTGGVVCKRWPPKLVAAGLGARARIALAVRQVVQSGIVACRGQGLWYAPVDPDRQVRYRSRLR